MILQSLGDQMTQREYYYKIASELNENNFLKLDYLMKKRYRLLK